MGYGFSFSYSKLEEAEEIFQRGLADYEKFQPPIDRRTGSIRMSVCQYCRFTVLYNIITVQGRQIFRGLASYGLAPFRMRFRKINQKYKRLHQYCIQLYRSVKFNAIMDRLDAFYLVLHSPAEKFAVEVRTIPESDLTKDQRIATDNMQAVRRQIQWKNLNYTVTVEGYTQIGTLGISSKSRLCYIFTAYKYNLYGCYRRCFVIIVCSSIQLRRQWIRDPETQRVALSSF